MFRISRLIGLAFSAVVALGSPSVVVAATRPTAITQTDTTTHTAPYATNGRTRTWALTWSTTGQLLTVDGPLSGTGDTVTYTYNSNGYLASVTDQVGHATTVSTWDGAGRPTTVTDANGVASTFTYDVRGRVLTATVNPGGSQSQYAFEYDAVGNLTEITLPGGGYLQYTYDTASRLTEIANDRGQTQTFGVNAMGDPTSLTVRTSGSTVTQQMSFVYDELGRLIQAIGAGSETTGFAYDKVDNQTGVTDARGKLFQTSFDALDRVITETNPQSQTVQYDYDPADKLKSHKDGRNLETIRTIDGFGQVIREVSPDSGTTDYWYDAAGNVTKIVDADGQETLFTYDAAGRLLTSSFTGASAETITYGYDATSGGNKGVGRLTSVTEESGSSAFVYDVQGRVTGDTKVIQGRTYAVGYAYDANGQVTQITLPSGRTVSYARAGDGLASGITTKATPSSSSETLASSIAYRPFGPLSNLTYGNGLALTRTYDNNYWLTQTEVKATGATRLDLSFGRNANGQLTSVTDNAASGRGATFTYTDSGRLASANGAWGDDAYVYDAAGNRTSKARTIGGTTTTEAIVLASTSNRVNQVQDGSSTTLRTLTHRTGGDRSQDAYAGGPTYDYSYNARKRLVAVDRDGADAASYGYDFQGRRVWRTVFGTTTVQSHYVFDQDGHLLAEHDGATGAVVREYVWLDDMPVAMVDSSSGAAQTYFIHTGQIEEPLVMTDASKAKVWDAYVEPYGKAQAFGTPSAGLDLRLPGQWLQAESGDLHQNWHRDYDPSLGRYIEVDPIGIAGGQNPYGYVDGRPLELIDPRGECPWCVAVGVGFAIGFAIDIGIQLHQNGGYWNCLDFVHAGISGAISGATAPIPVGRLLGWAGARFLPIAKPAAFGAKGVGSGAAAEGAGAAANGVKGLTNIGRGLAKHGGRKGSAFPKPTGNPDAVNKQAQGIIDDIVNSEGRTVTTRHHARFGNVREIRAPDGRGVRYGADGEFIGFLEP